MKTLVLLTLVLFSINAFAIESVVVLTSGEINKNETIMGAGDDESTIAARVLQLQLQEVKCGNITVLPDTLENAIEYKFYVDSEICVVKPKKSECDPGYDPRNMLVNPNTPNDIIIGGDKYKVCVKSGGAKKESKSSGGK
ncbi:MAG: hypothetical protein V4654_10285 [Bdellovibrionota bacterium]